MGMFDNITVGTTLPELPEAIITHWGGKASDVVFQTKDTPNQAMSHYKIDGAGLLWVKKVEGHWTESKPVADDAPFREKMAAMSHFVIEHEWWEEEKFTGAINFYESYNHPDYKSPDADYDSDEWRRFVSGWVEYCALFKDGKLIEDIQLTVHTPPKKYTDEEYAAKQEEWKADREKWDERLKESRKKYPSTEQQLIDNIEREAKLASAIFDEQDLSNALSNIRILIREYREKHDRWYEQ
jgi:uncharacterized membrane protein